MKDPKKNIKILKYLSKQDFLTYQDVTHFFDDFEHTPATLIWGNDAPLRAMYDFLDHMKALKHIDYRASSSGEKNAEAVITLEGLKYFDELADANSNRRFAIASIIVSAITILVTIYFSIIANNSKSDFEKLEQRILKLEAKK